MRVSVAAYLLALFLIAMACNTSNVYQQRRHFYENCLSGCGTPESVTTEPSLNMHKPYKPDTNLPIGNHTPTATPTIAATSTIPHSIQSAVQDDLADPVISAAALVGSTEWIPGNYGKVLGPVLAHMLSDGYNRLENVPGVYHAGDKVKNFGKSEIDGIKEYFHRHAASTSTPGRISPDVKPSPMTEN